jgi:hypothetical protein
MSERPTPITDALVPSESFIRETRLFDRSYYLPLLDHARDLERQQDELREALLKSKRDHYYCEDSWYSCPLSEDGCADEQYPNDECNCGADKYNKSVDALLARMKP